MQDRPDLIQSELAGLAFDSLQQVFRKQDILMMFETEPLPLTLNPTIWVVIDPAAGGPQSDYAVVSLCRIKGCVVVRVYVYVRVVCVVCVDDGVLVMCMRGPHASRDHVGVLARADEGVGADLLVREVVEHEALAQVLEEAHDLVLLVAGRGGDDELLELRVDVEQQHEEREQHDVVGVRRGEAHGAALRGGAAFEEVALDARDGAEHARAEQAGVLREQDALEEVGGARRTDFGALVAGDRH